MDAVVGLGGSSARGVVLSTGNDFFELWEHAHPEPRPQDFDKPVSDHGINHVCFEVTDLEAVFARLTESGVHFDCEPQHPGYARVTYARDPFGNVIEFIETLDPDYPSVSRSWAGDRYKDVVHH